MKHAFLPLLLFLLAACARPPAQPAEPLAGAITQPGDEAFLDTLQARTFRWFWDTTDPETGLTPDRWPTRTFSSVAAIGYGLTAYGVGVERGYVAREDAAERTLATLCFLWAAPQGTDQTGMAGYKGFFYHFLEYDDGSRFRNTELSSIDTGLLMMGVLFAREYFDGDAPAEAAIRAYADSLYQRAEWDFFQAQSPLLTMGWEPEAGFGRAEYEGYNEAMFLYLIALGSPTFPASEDAWDVFTSSYTWGDFYGFEHVNFSPLFGHQYSHVWIDFRGIQDEYMRGRGIDYFENSRRAVLSQRAYAIDNPGGWKDYGENVWGLTACDGPYGGELEYEGEMRRFYTYFARGASLEYIQDDGTIAPTAAGGSVPFAPEVTIPALRTMAERYGTDLFTEYGFLDSFNPSFTFPDVRPQHGRVVPGKGWFDGDYLGIDQGAILLMVENHRSGLVWETMKRSPYLVRGLQRAGFTGGWLDTLAALPEPAVVITERQPEPAEAGGGPLLVVLGSSTAEGVGPQEAANTWVGRLRVHLKAEMPEARVLNLARGGYSTYRLLPTSAAVPAGRPGPDPARNVTAALQRQPAAIVLNLTSNDTAYGFSVEEQLANYEAIAAAAEAAGVPIWVTTTLPRDLDDAGRQAQMDLRDAIRERWGERAIDFWTDIARDDGRLDPRWDSGDGLHLNDEAHRLLFERVRDSGVLEALAAEPEMQE